MLNLKVGASVSQLLRHEQVPPHPGRGHLSLPDLDPGDQNMPRELPFCG